MAILIPNAVNFEFISEVKYKEGRFVLVKGKLDNEELTLFNVYAPPGSKKIFFKKLFELVVLETQGGLIYGGDLNVQLQSKLDTSNQRQKKSPSAILIQWLLAELGLIDEWRESHPGEKQFTYYSPCHCVYSQINYLFISKSDWHRVRDCKIGIRDVSDHSGVYLTLFLTHQRKNTLWRLNTSILNDKTVQSEIQQEFKTYLQNNDNGEVSPNTLWDAAKAVVRGKIIALMAFRKKEKDLLNYKRK